MLTAHQIRIVAALFFLRSIDVQSLALFTGFGEKARRLRHGAPFRHWELPRAIQQVRNRLLQQSQGARAFVDCLLLAREHSLDALETACELTLESGEVTGSIVQNEMRRLTEPDRPKELTASQHLQLKAEPQANTQRYDHLLGVGNVH